MGFFQPKLEGVRVFDLAPQKQGALRYILAYKKGVKKTSKNRTRPIQILFCVSEEEKALLHKKRENAGFKNMDAFIRKMLFTGYIVKVDFEPINELVSLTGRLSNNVNQLAKKANSYEAITSEDIQTVRELTQSINDTNKQLLEKIEKL